MQKIVERRKNPRQRVAWKIALVPTLESSGVRLDSVGIDLTILGIAVQCPRSCTTGEKFIVYFEPPALMGKASRILKLSASTVYSLSNGQGWRIGLKFAENQSLAHLMDALRVAPEVQSIGRVNVPTGMSQDRSAEAGQVSQRQTAQVRPSLVSAIAQPESLLDKIKAEAEKKLADQEMSEFLKQSLQEEWHREVDSALRPVLSYFSDLAKSFNILNPTHANGFSIPCVTVMENLRWVDSSAGFRVRKAASDIDIYESVSLSYQWRGTPERLKVVVRKEDAKVSEQSLEKCGIQYHYEKVANLSGQLEAVFSFPNTLSCTITLLPDDRASQFRIRLRNVGAAGLIAYVVPLEALNKPLLDELVRLMIGENNAVATLLKKADSLDPQI